MRTAKHWLQLNLSVRLKKILVRKVTSQDINVLIHIHVYVSACEF